MQSEREQLKLGHWLAERMTGRLVGPGEARQIEPKVMDLLFVLADEPGRVVSRRALMDALWPAVTVGEDALARCVFKLRAALRNGPDEACAVETIPKRGYRLVMAPPSAPAATELPQPPVRRSALQLGGSALFGAAVIAGTLFATWGGKAGANELTLDRARDAYFQYSYPDNEAAIQLFERVLVDDSANPEALAGLSSALVQRVIRWPAGVEVPISGSRLQHALRSGRLTRPGERWQLTHALVLADAAVAADPRNAESLRARGLALAALGRRAEAADANRRAIRLDRQAWGAMINLADLLDLDGRKAEAAEMMGRAYDSMHLAYGSEPARVRPWFAAVGTDVARRHLQLGDRQAAIRWYSRTIRDHPQATEATREFRHLLSRDTG